MSRYNSAVYCPIVLKFGRQVLYGPVVKAENKWRTDGLKWQCSANCYLF